MTIEQAISRTDELCPNQYTEEQKRLWLSRLDGIIKTEIHVDGEDLPDYSSAAGTTELLVPFPYDEIYIYWLITQIYLNNAEMDNYNAELVLYNTAYVDYANFYTRTNMPTQKTAYFKT